MNADHILAYPDHLVYDVKKSFTHAPEGLARCPMCGGEVTATKRLGATEQMGQVTSAGLEYLKTGMIPVLEATSLSCKCGWWAHEEHFEDYEVSYGWDILVAGVLQKWEVSSHAVPVAILRDHLLKNGSAAFLATDPSAFERLMAHCLAYELGPCAVHHVGARGGRGDGGVDIYLVKDETEWLIQVKRRLADRKEGVETVRLLNGVLLREGKAHGMVVTSAHGFTKGAMRESVPVSAGAYCVRLIDRGDVLAMLQKIPSSAEEARTRALSAVQKPTGDRMSEELEALFEGGHRGNFWEEHGLSGD